ncbi:MAG: DUF421 domain-containing protein [Firmicutes bacterium]|nr:DUF421 domain-containing protein [Bacillota bacterium]
MLIVFARALVLYLTVILVMRIMGKRQVGQLQPFEFVLALLLADLAAVPMQNKEIPLINGFIPIFSLLLVQVTLAYLNLKSQRARAIICGTPSILIKDGLIQEKTLQALGYNLNDLLEQLRAAGYHNIGEVEVAILETNGNISVIPKSQYRAVRPADLRIPTKYEGLPLTIIIDGVVDHRSLKMAGLDWHWLEEQLKAKGAKDPTDVLYAVLDTEGRFFCQLHAGKSKDKEGQSS